MYQNGKTSGVKKALRQHGVFKNTKLKGVLYPKKTKNGLMMPRAAAVKRSAKLI